MGDNSEYLESAFGGGANDCFDGTGGASGRYGHQTPLDGLHRRGIFETDFRAMQQRLSDERSGASFFDSPRAPLNLSEDCFPFF